MAHALDMLCKYPELADKMEELDNVKIPEFESFECEASQKWHRE